MLTTIFTGHTLDLTDIVAVGPIMASQKTSHPFLKRTLFLEIFLKGGTVLRHDDVTQTILGGEPTSQEADRWRIHHDLLEEQRTKLIDQWQDAKPARSI